LSQTVHTYGYDQADRPVKSNDDVTEGKKLQR
jgi:hypothetical protein